MGAKIIIAAILGGAAIFGAGFAEHMILDWTGRTFKKVEQETEFREAMKKYFPTPGIYCTPGHPANFAQMTMEEKKKAMEDLAPAAKEHRGFFIVPPPVEDMMDKKFMIMQGVVCVIAALLASVVMSMTRPEVGFLGRWFACVLIGAIIWLSTSAELHLVRLSARIRLG